MMARRVFGSDGQKPNNRGVKLFLFGPMIGLPCDDPSEMASFCGKRAMPILIFEV